MSAQAVGIGSLRRPCNRGLELFFDAPRERGHARPSMSAPA
jgi:hypothetical protein